MGVPNPFRDCDITELYQRQGSIDGVFPDQYPEQYARLITHYCVQITTGGVFRPIGFALPGRLICAYCYEELPHYMKDIFALEPWTHVLTSSITLHQLRGCAGCQTELVYVQRASECRQCIEAHFLITDGQWYGIQMGDMVDVTMCYSE